MSRFKYKLSLIARLLGHRNTPEEQHAARVNEGMLWGTRHRQVFVREELRYDTAHAKVTWGYMEYDGYTDEYEALYVTESGRWFLCSSKWEPRVFASADEVRQYLVKRRDVAAAERLFGSFHAA